MNEFNLIFESRNRWIISQIGTRSRDDSGNEAELGWNGNLGHAANLGVEFDQMFSATAQLWGRIFKLIEGLIRLPQDFEFASQSMRSLGFVLGPFGAVTPITLSVIAAKVA